MASRRIVSAFVIVGVLMHAAALVSHNVAMLQMAMLAVSPLSSLGLICISDSRFAPGQQSKQERSKGPENLPQNGKLNCPVCTGLTPAAALPASGSGIAAVPVFAEDLPRPESSALAILSRTTAPPSTGPPAAA